MAPRRAATAESDDSQKENRVKPERGTVKKERVSGVRKQSQSQSLRTRGQEEEEEEERESAGGAGGEDDKEEEEEEGEGEGSPRGHKRTRLNTDGDGAPVKEEKGKGRAYVEFPRDEDGYVPGSIVRVQLQNFVTYDYVEFMPGPYLNMILGPNGTGKSSIACALCIGLNFNTNILGRASDLNSFVKLGTDRGYVEIELKGKKGQGNLTIRRNLSATLKSSTFTLNGQAATGKEVTNRIAELNIQVGNLCSFLPQDKVAEFARMTPQELLRQTQKAAENENLTAWHDTLISSGKEAAQLRETLEAEKAQLETMEERNKLLKKDVDKYNDRMKIEERIALLELILPVKEYGEAFKRYNETKAEQRRLHAEVQTLKERNAPAHELLKKLDREHKRLNQEREERKKVAKAKFGAMKKKYDDCENLETEVQDYMNRLDNLKKEEKETAKAIADLEKKIQKLDSDIANPPEMEDLDAINAEIKTIQQVQREINQRQYELQDRQKAHANDVGKWRAAISQAQEGITRLNDVEHQKLQQLSRWDRDCADTIEWLRQNQHRFRMPILEPAVISVTVPDKKYATAVEACFSQTQFKTFVAQCDEDYDTLNHLVNDTDKALGRKARVPTWFRPHSASGLMQPPLSVQELRDLRFDGYALDYIRCPEEMKWYLRKELQLHRTAIALDGSEVPVAEAMDLVSRLDRGGGGKFIAGMTMNTVQRSRYGQRLPQNSTNDIRPARNFGQNSVDTDAMKRFDSQIATARQNLALLEEQVKELTELEAKIHAETKENKAKNEALNGQKQAVLKIQQTLQRMKINRDEAQKQLDKALNKPPVEAQRTQLKQKILDNCRKRSKLARDLQELARAAIKEQAEATRIGLKVLQTASNSNALQQLVDEHDKEYQKTLEEYTKAEKLFKAAKAESKEKLDISKEKLDAADAEIRDSFQEMEQTGEVNQLSIEDVQSELETQRIELSMNLNTNASVIEQFERRKGEIESLSRTIEGKERRMAKIERGIKAAQDNWEPALEKLVESIGAKFSAAFDRIGCAGEIRISRHEDFDKWAIDILVKFRDSEKLQLLTGQRQSGGERSLTTIMYLMSLTEEARAPFSLVDEINQGMDQRAERAVHNELVAVTCKADSRQYFLITPKLLPDLRYHERMKILCVNNGEWLPEEKGLGNLMTMIETYVHRQSRGNASA